MTPGILPSISTDLSNFFVVSLCPFYHLNQVAEVCLDRNIMHSRFEVTIKVLIVFGILLEHYSIAGQKVGEAICCYCTIYVQLVLVLKPDMNG